MGKETEDKKNGVAFNSLVIDVNDIINNTEILGQSTSGNDNKEIKYTVDGVSAYAKEMQKGLNDVVDIYQFKDKKKSIDFFEKKLIRSFYHLDKESVQEVKSIFDSQKLVIDKETVPNFIETYRSNVNSSMGNDTSIALKFMEIGPQISYQDFDTSCLLLDSKAPRGSRKKIKFTFCGIDKFSNFVSYSLNNESNVITGIDKDEFNSYLIKTVKNAFKEGLSEDFVQKVYVNLLDFNDLNLGGVCTFSELTGTRINLKYKAYNDLPKDSKSEPIFVQELYKGILDDEQINLDDRLKRVSYLSEVFDVSLSSANIMYAKSLTEELLEKYNIK
jgi:hypothetical protein